MALGVMLMLLGAAIFAVAVRRGYMASRWLPLLIALAPPSLALVGVVFVSWVWLVPLVPFTLIAAFGVADWSSRTDAYPGAALFRYRGLVFLAGRTIRPKLRPRCSATRVTTSR